MKRFLVFAGDNYYPGGGMSDFKKDFEELVEAQAYAQGLLEHEDWAHIYDQVNRENVRVYE